MKKVKNSIWSFFTSVKLALFVLIILATTSIIGTLIKQEKAAAFYVEEYGESLARLFGLLGFTDMYHSWWFIALLALFAVNLVVCSIERLPGVWRLVVQDYLSIDPRQLETMASSHRTASNLAPTAAAERMDRLLARAGWGRPRRLERDGAILLFAQKGAWSRLGVYVVHLSILVIMAGGVIGAYFGLEAYVYLPEGRSTGNVFLQRTQEPIPLGFEVQCDQFEKFFYPNGMVRSHRADLSVYAAELKAPYEKSIIVNDPLSYQGFTFYLADSYPMEEFFVLISNRTTGREQAFRVPPEQDAVWPGTELSFRIEEPQLDQDGVLQQARLRFAADATTAAELVPLKNQAAIGIRQAGQEFSLSLRQLHSVLLVVKKDPGILTVYTGCILMMFGLGICCFLSHRRVWVLIKPQAGPGSQIQLSGSGNKNKAGFEQRFAELVARAGQDDVLGSVAQKP